MKATFDQHIGVFEDAVPKEWCNKVIKIFEDNMKASKSRLESEFQGPLQKKDQSHSLSYLQPDLCKEFSYNFWKNIFPLYTDEFYLENIVHFPALYISDFKLQKTLPTGGYHIWHAERNHMGLGVNRVMVYTLYLNDVEEGGETEFLIQSKRIKAKQGTVCIFPAEYTHIHRGNPPLSGEKYIMTGWLNYLSPKENLTVPEELKHPLCPKPL